MKRWASGIAFCVAFVASSAWPEAAPPASNDIGNLVTGGKVTLNFRYRYEYVDDDAYTKEAKASTLRSRLTLQSGTWENFAFMAEFSDVSTLGPDAYNADKGNTPGKIAYPIVADPEVTEVNQAYVDYTGIANLKARVGRQRINLDNQRFIGGSAWRQNEQTFDAASAAYDRGPVHVFYAYVDKVHRIYGDDVPDGEHTQGATNFVNVRGDLGAIGTLTGYYYGIDDDDNATYSTDTFGVRFAGKHAFPRLSVRYAAELARQSDAHDNPVSYDANYYLLEGGVLVSWFDGGVGWELLDGNADSPGEAFRTPFATLHAFNGWVDKFLTTPNEGLDDRFTRVNATFKGTIVEVRYDDFRGQDDSHKLGDEWDVQIGHEFHKRLRGDLYFGDFSGSDPRYQDTLKAWLVVTVNLP